VSFDELSALLATLRSLDMEEFPFPKYRYPSAGDLYPVQTYVWIKAGRVSDLTAGLYYYHPGDHYLVLIEPEARIDRDVHHPKNQALFEDSAFSVFLVGRLDAVAPMYPHQARDFCLLEGGYMGQLLMTEAPSARIGLCPIGSLQFDRICRHFRLAERQALVHCLVGGKIDSGAGNGPAATPAIPPTGDSSVPEIAARAAGEEKPAPKPLLDPIERLEFKLSRPGRRKDLDGRWRVPLEWPESADRPAAYRRRRSHRQFQDRAVDLDQLSVLLEALRRIEIDGLPFLKARYPSAGDMYPVQVYLHVKPHRVSGLAGGTYYYQPEEHILVRLARDVEIDRDFHWEPNRDIFDGAAFSLFLVAELAAIVPIYGPDFGRDFSLLEAGYLSQLLMEEAPQAGLGLCPIGDLDFDRVRGHLDLEDSHVLLHSLLGGVAVDEAGWRAAPGPEEVARPPEVTSGESIAPSGSFDQQVRDHLGGRLPAYMVPSRVVIVDELPLTSNGKVDRNALSALATQPPPAPSVYTAPESELEVALVAMWQEVLKVEKVGIHDAFFDLGGTSVHMIQVHSKLRKALGHELPLAEMFFKYPTISTLAAHLEEKSPQTDAAAAQRRQARAESGRRKRLDQRKSRQAHRSRRKSPGDQDE
jgi:SagB-type dehydrogenase family enzyme